MAANFTKRYKSVSQKSRTGFKKVTVFIQRRPLISFFLSLLILLLLIVAGNFLTPKKPETKTPEIVKSVQIYKLNTSPKVTLQAKIEKSGVIKINALAPGIIQSINFKEGDTVKKGQVLVNMSSNYQGGNAAAIQSQIAQKQYQNSKDTYQNQKDIIDVERHLANATESNSSQLRDITNQSLSETQSSIDLNQFILDTLTQNETDLENNNPGGVNNTAILQIKSQRAAVQGGLNQLKTALRQSQFQAASDKPPAELTGVQKDLTLKQLDIQDKSLDLGLEVSRLQAALAGVNASLYFPASPFTGTIQRIYVKEGENVNPGTPLMTISATVDPITAVVSLPQNLASAVSSIEPSTLYIGDQTISLNPTFVSTEATDGTLYSVIYTIPDSYSKDLTEGGSVSVDIPVGIDNPQSSIPFIPLDSVYQSADIASVLVAQGDKAVSKNIVLGNLFGSFVEVKSGLNSDDQIILDRNVLSGDKISIQ